MTYMIEQIKAGDKLTYIEVSSLASTIINEITIDDIREDKLIFSRKRKQYCFKPNDGTLILKGHNLGIIRGSWGENGGSCFLMDANCNIGGLDRESMTTLLKTNINPLFNEWNRINWFDGTSDVGDPLFVPRPTSDNYLRYRKEAEDNNSKLAPDIAIGEFINSLSKGSKHNNLTDMLNFHLNKDTASDEYFSLGKVVDIIEMSDDEFTALKYSTGQLIVTDRGGSFTDDIADDRDFSNLSDFERGTIYSHLTLIRTPSGRAITVDVQGHDYMRYTGLLPHYHESMAEDCAKALDAINSAQDKKTQQQLPPQQQPKAIMVAKEEAPLKPDDLKIVDYSEKSFVVIGDTKPIKEKLKELGGRFNSRLTCGAGWVFSKTRIEVVKTELAIA